ncbi:MAG TPA: M1 family metallopeptidase [Flavitalea sp.]|nr:M1 family metallopeptidase [Flavitalea sp.]
MASRIKFNDTNLNHVSYPIASVRNNFLAVILVFTGLVVVSSCKGQPLQQNRKYIRQDSLRGTITPERAWWNVLHYAITVEPDYQNKTIIGSNRIRFRTVSDGRKMQIDMQVPMQIDSVVEIKFRTDMSQNIPLLRTHHDFTWEGHVTWVDLGRMIKKGNEMVLEIYFHGKPVEARRPPWDGGWIWSKDKKGRPWMSVACQGLGASVWYPCKDHQSDEPDEGATLSIITSDTLMAVGNGRLIIDSSLAGSRKLRTWEVKNPINNYNIVPYIGKYVNWNEQFTGEKGVLDCSYWVLDYNLEKAKAQFKQVPLMLTSFEHWFGPYPFYEDGYKLVESPHLGMEHQSAVAYGNDFINGYRGNDLSGTGWGKKWDFIIVHESGHEWFANNITTNDLADMWVHEGFTNYSETLFTTSQYGIEAGNDYVIGTRRLIKNDIPIIGPYGVNQEGSGDMYYKGGNLLHMIRQVINNDEKFRNILRGLNKTFYHQTVDSRQVESFISKEAGIDFSHVFDQYLRTAKIPILEYKSDGKKILVRWTNCVPGFDLPLAIKNGKKKWIKPVENWKEAEGIGATKSFADLIDRNFYIQVKKTD